MPSLRCDMTRSTPREHSRSTHTPCDQALSGVPDAPRRRSPAGAQLLGAAVLPPCGDGADQREQAGMSAGWRSTEVIGSRLSVLPARRSHERRTQRGQDGCRRCRRLHGLLRGGHAGGSQRPPAGQCPRVPTVGWSRSTRTSGSSPSAPPSAGPGVLGKGHRHKRIDQRRVPPPPRRPPPRSRSSPNGLTPRHGTMLVSPPPSATAPRPSPMAVAVLPSP